MPELVLKRAEEGGKEAAAASGEEAGSGEGEDSGEKEGAESGSEPAEGEKDRFLRTFRETVLVERVAEAEKVILQEEEVDGYLSAVYGASGRSLVDLKRNLDSHGLLEEVRRRLLRAKVCELLASKCRIVQEGAGSEPLRPEKEGEEKSSSNGEPDSVSLKEEGSEGSEKEPAREADPGKEEPENGREEERKAQ